MLDIIIQNENFVNNKYKKWYINIIRNRLEQVPDGYFESHHIVPVSIRKDLRNNKNNIVNLTAKEHFICHLLLARFTVGLNRRNMCFAVTTMARSTKKHDRKFTSGYYQLARLHYKKSSVGRKHSEETKRKISEANKGRPSPNRGNKFGGARTEESKLKISLAKRGVPLSEEHKSKLSELKKGKKRGKYTRHREYEKSQCIYCGIISIISNINRWHNDNCKIKEHHNPHL